MSLHLPAVVSAYIRLALDDGEDVADVFKAARELADGIAAKAYADTRAKFRAEVERLITAANDSSMSRAQFGGGMRSALRRFGFSVP